MAGKYDYISALAEMTAADIVKNKNELLGQPWSKRYCPD